MRFTREAIPPTFNGKPAEYRVMGGFRDASPLVKAVYAVSALFSLGTTVAFVEGMTFLNARHTAKQSLRYKHNLEKTAPQGEWPKRGPVMEYGHYAQEIAQNTAQLRASAGGPSYMSVTNSHEINSGGMPGAFEQRVRAQAPVGTRGM